MYGSTQVDTGIYYWCTSRSVELILHSNTMPVDVLIEFITSDNIPGARLAAATIKDNSSLILLHSMNLPAKAKIQW